MFGDNTIFCISLKGVSHAVDCKLFACPRHDIERRSTVLAHCHKIGDLCFGQPLTLDMTPSLEDRVSDLERRLRQLSTDIDFSIAKDQELLARLRSGQGTWRALQRMREHEDVVSWSSGDPHSDSSVAGTSTTEMPQTSLLPDNSPTKSSPSSTTEQQQEGDSSALTDQTVVLSERSVSDQNKQTSMTGHRDANSI